MKTFGLFIFIAIFCQTTAKVFLLTLDAERGKERHNDSAILEKDQEEETVNKGKEADGKEVGTAKGVKPKPAGTHTVGDETDNVQSRVAFLSSFSRSLF